MKRNPGANVPAVRIRGAVKKYGSTAAVNGLELKIPEGQFLGLLGPNGAGKSTTMHMLTGQSRGDTGTVEVFGHHLPKESRRVRSLIGTVPQHDNLDVEVTVRQNLDIFARFGSLPASEYARAVDRALDAVRLTDRANDRVDALSGGMRRRVLLPVATDRTHLARS
ncbi:ATP-binding cassette domain-containing protein [Streptomyces sp. NPDC005151]